MAIKVKQYKSIKTLKSSLKRNAASGSYLVGVPEDGMVVRFLTEPEEWLEYQEFFNENTNRSEIVTEDWVKPAGSSRNPSKRFGACVLNREGGEVVGVRLSSTIVQDLILYYEKYGTIMDRDYELIREGKGLDTRYKAIPEAPQRLRTDKYELLDIMGILESMASEGEDDDEEDDTEEDDEDVPARGSRRKVGSTSKKRRRQLEEEDDEDEEEDDEDEEEEEDDDDEPPFARKSARSRTMRARKSKRR